MVVVSLSMMVVVVVSAPRVVVVVLGSSVVVVVLGSTVVVVVSSKVAVAVSKEAIVCSKFSIVDVDGVDEGMVVKGGSLVFNPGETGSKATKAPLSMLDPITPSICNSRITHKIII